MKIEEKIGERHKNTDDPNPPMVPTTSASKARKRNRKLMVWNMVR